MIYDRGVGKRNFRLLRGLRPPDETLEPTDAVRQVILRVMADNPRWSPEEVYSAIRLIRHDIPLAMVEAVMAAERRTRRSRKTTR